MIDETPRTPDTPVPGTETPLTSPHFDETAVAVAQPVEPLPPERFRSSNLSLQPFVIIVAFGLVLTVITVATGFLVASEQARASEASAGAVQPEPPAEPSATESTPAAAAASEEINVPSVIPEKHSGRSRRMLMRSRSLNGIAPIVTDEQGRPAARKVGEIRYGRSPDRP